MRAIVVERQGNPVTPNIKYRTDWPELAMPAPGYVNIKTLATAFNQMDLWVGRGVPGLTLQYPRVSGCDSCGVVEAVGPGVDQSWIGRKVIPNAATRVAERCHPDDPTNSTLAPIFELIGEHHNGMMAEKYTIPVSCLVAVNNNSDAIEAAAFPLCFLTAWSMIVTKGQLRSGQNVLITGIGGGVATSALAIAKHFGCRVIVTSRQQWKLDKAKALGADAGILDAGQDWSKDVRAFTNKRGVDMAVDTSGKATHLTAIKSLGRGGAYVTAGCTSGPDATTDLARIFWNQLRILGSTMGTTDELKELAALYNAGKLKPVVDQVFKPEDAQKAYARLEGAEQFGKIVINWQ